MDFFSDMRKKALIGYDRFDEMRKKDAIVLDYTPVPKSKVDRLLHFNGNTYDERAGITISGTTIGGYQAGLFGQEITSFSELGKRGHFYNGSITPKPFNEGIYSGPMAFWYQYCPAMVDDSHVGTLWPNNKQIEFFVTLPNNTVDTMDITFDFGFKIYTTSHQGQYHKLNFKQSISAYNAKYATWSRFTSDLEIQTAGIVPDTELEPGKRIHICLNIHNIIKPGRDNYLNSDFDVDIYINGRKCYSEPKVEVPFQYEVQVPTDVQTTAVCAISCNVPMEELLVRYGKTDFSVPTKPYKIVDG